MLLKRELNMLLRRELNMLSGKPQCSGITPTCFWQHVYGVDVAAAWNVAHDIASDPRVTLFPDTNLRCPLPFR